jgi:hypothetical protein
MAKMVTAKRKVLNHSRKSGVTYHHVSTLSAAKSIKKGPAAKSRKSQSLGGKSSQSLKRVPKKRKMDRKR